MALLPRSRSDGLYVYRLANGRLQHAREVHGVVGEARASFSHESPSQHGASPGLGLFHPSRRCRRSLRLPVHVVNESHQRVIRLAASRSLRCTFGDELLLKLAHDHVRLHRLSLAVSASTGGSPGNTTRSCQTGRRTPSANSSESSSRTPRPTVSSREHGSRPSWNASSAVALSSGDWLPSTFTAPKRSGLRTPSPRRLGHADDPLLAVAGQLHGPRNTLVKCLPPDLRATRLAPSSVASSCPSAWTSARTISGQSPTAGDPSPHRGSQVRRTADRLRP